MKELACKFSVVKNFKKNKNSNYELYCSKKVAYISLLIPLITV
jgi:hypothetical protein